jgi:5-formyltetrahydrofolate cyclo-ligase
MMTTRPQLRQAIRQQRQALTPAESDSCATRLARHITNSRLVHNSRLIAVYLAADGEIDPLPLMQRLWALGKKVYLPVLEPFSDNRLWFVKFEPGDHLVYNRYGIPEPERRHRRLIKPNALDLVFTPLVAFDLLGNRLGMGGGYYDRSFAFLNRRIHWRKPRLVGLAYDFQRLNAINHESWDIPLHAIATDQRIYYCENTRTAV